MSVAEQRKYFCVWSGSGADTNVRQLKGVGDKTYTYLKRLGIETFADLLHHFPRTYDDWSELKPLSMVEDGAQATVKARIISPPKQQFTRGRLKLFKAELQTEFAEIVTVVWFNQPWVTSNAWLTNTENILYFRGTVHRQLHSKHFQLENPQFKSEAQFQKNKVEPVYPLTAGLKNYQLQSFITQLLTQIKANLTETMPAELLQRHNLPALKDAICWLHAPVNMQQVDLAKKRLAFDEMVLTRLALLKLRSLEISKQYATALKASEQAKQIFTQIYKRIPYRLTDDQNKAIDSILQGLRQDRPLNLLVQGDVGSGKTIVAILAMAYCALCGGQAVLLAPTTILAEQHYRVIEQILAGSGIKVGLLTSASKGKARKQLLTDIASGEVQLLVGTHAIQRAGIEYNKPVLLITDEQHRFGVNQRRLGTDQADDWRPHHVVMSATPIPRTLGLIIFGDLDIVKIQQKPAGRQSIQTKSIGDGELQGVYAHIRELVARGQQAYIVCPLVEESLQLDIDSLEEVYEFLSKIALPNLRLAKLHGAMKAEQKEQIMSDFTQGKIDVLISTTVVEVGVDNPNANLILIRNCERFGISQLHQLRGRVGRGKEQAYCYLHSQQTSELTRERILALCQSDDGFILAEKDLELRGFGDFFGTKQHGLPQLTFAQKLEDPHIVDQAIEAVEQLLAIGIPETVEQAIITQYPQLRYGIVL